MTRILKRIWQSVRVYAWLIQFHVRLKHFKTVFIITSFFKAIPVTVSILYDIVKHLFHGRISEAKSTFKQLITIYGNYLKVIKKHY